MNTDSQTSCQACGCDEGAKHLCLACLNTGKGYGSSLRVNRAPVPANGLAYVSGKPLFPASAEGRKAHPIFTGVLMYFPDAIAAVAHVSKLGNDQHNPGEPLHWARGKSTDQMDAAIRHMMDHGIGNTKDSSGSFHLANAAWRILAELQLTIERERKGL